MMLCERSALVFLFLSAGSVNPLLKGFKGYTAVVYINLFTSVLDVERFLGYGTLYRAGKKTM